jgi:diacylglycerol kinase family enzyme
MSLLPRKNSLPAIRARSSPRARHSTAWARLAAAVAVVAMIGWVAVVASTIVLEFGDVLLALASVFGLTFFGWFVLTRRSPARWLGVPGAILGLAGLIGFLGAHWSTFLVLVGAGALFGVAGRYAVRCDRTAVHGAQRSAWPAGSTLRGVLIINPNSGGGKAERFDLREEARKRGVEPLMLGPGDDLRELADRAVADGAEVLGMAGGDGSQAVVAAVAMQNDLAHVCVPAGTLNHFALDLGLDRDDVVGALDAFTDGIERRIDLASVNDRIFVNNASLGVYAGVVQSNAYRDAKLRTWRRVIPEMLGPGPASIDLRFEGPDSSDWRSAALVLVSNNPYQLRRFAGAGTRPRLDTGELGILAAGIRGARDIARLVTLATLGQARRFRGLREWSSPEFEVSSRACVAIGLDGEALLLAPPLRFVSLPGALRVRLPRQAAGVSPAGAAVMMTRHDLTGLIRIAAGKPDTERRSSGDKAGTPLAREHRTVPRPEDGGDSRPQEDIRENEAARFAPNDQKTQSPSEPSRSVTLRRTRPRGPAG